jgi:ArsR family transcriptional regulator
VKSTQNSRKQVTAGKKVAVAKQPRASKKSAECCPPSATSPRKHADGDVGDSKKAAGKPKLIEILKGLADETRLEIVTLLSKAEGEVCVCEIEAHIAHLSQPTISHHLKLLRDSRIVTAERRGTWVYYALSPAIVRQLRKWIEALCCAK